MIQLLLYFINGVCQILATFLVIAAIGLCLFTLYSLFTSNIWVQGLAVVIIITFIGWMLSDEWKGN